MRMALVAKDRTLCLIILAGVVSEDCAAFFQLPVVGEERAVVMSRKDSLTNAGWPSQPWRGRSRHRPHLSYGAFLPSESTEPLDGNRLDTSNAKATKYCHTSIITCFQDTRRGLQAQSQQPISIPMIASSQNIICNSPISLNQIVHTLLLLSVLASGFGPFPNFCSSSLLSSSTWLSSNATEDLSFLTTLSLNTSRNWVAERKLKGLRH